MKGFKVDRESKNPRKTDEGKKVFKEKIIAEAFKLHSQGNIKKAAKCYQDIIAKGFSEPRVFSNYGAILIDLGKLKEAELLTRKAIELKPEFAEAHLNLGAILIGLNKEKEAESKIRKAIKIRPNFAEAHFNLGKILHHMCRLEEAKLSLSKAIELQPGYIEAYYNLGNILIDIGKLKEAELAHRKAIELKPDFAEAHFTLGNILKNKGKIKEAESCLTRAIELKPNFIEAYINLGIILKVLGKTKEAEFSLKKAIEINPNCAEAYYNLGKMFNDRGQSQEAHLLTQKAIELNPNFAEAYLNLGVILNTIGKTKEAQNSLRKAIKNKPDYAEAYYNLGDILNNIGEFKEAELCTRKAIKLKPNYAEAYLNLGVILNTIGKSEEAEKSTRKSIDLKPNFLKANYNLSTILLRSKKFKEGWQRYEWRWKLKRHKGSRAEKLQKSKPEWIPGKGGRVLLWAEQGIGDEIMYASMIQDFVKVVDKLIVQVDERLIPLLKRSFKEKIIYITRNQLIKKEDYDYQIAMGSLPKYLRISEESFERDTKEFLKADERKTKILLKQIKESKFDKIVGISWSSKSTADKKKSISLEEFITSIHAPNICFVNLQYGDTKEEINNIKKKYNINIYEAKDVDIFNNIDDLAALIDACDQIISIDNITAVLAGALGADCNLILGLKGYFYWGGINDTKSYWLPSLKLFRQTNLQSWDEPLRSIKKNIFG